MTAPEPAPVAPRETEPLPAAIGPFWIEGVLGQGGMGVVYRARHQKTGAPVALKTVRLRKESHLASIRREMHALGKVRHPGIVQIIEHGQEGELPWYAMDLLEGQTLEDFQQRIWATPGHIAAGGSLVEVLTLVRRICDPLGFLHGEGIVHADLKPQNVFLRDGTRPVLVDFGVSRLIGSRGREISDLPAGGGTHRYMSPHHVTAELLEPRDDLYSLGCMLYELVAGRPPFVGTGTVALALAHLAQQAPPLSSLVDGVPPALDALVASLLAKQPRDRPGHAEDVSRALIELGALRDDAPRERPRPYLYRPSLVGRSAEVAALTKLTERLIDGGPGGVALIAGESGIGKTYLALEMSQRASKNGVRVIHGSCVPAVDGAAAGGPPLHAFRELLLAIADRCASEGAPARERLLGGRGRVLAAIEPSLLPPSTSSEAEPLPLSGSSARDRLLSACQSAFLAFARDQPVLFVIDDLQWADELSWRLLERLVTSHRSSLLILGTVRTDEAAALPSAEGAMFQRIRVGRLDLAALRSLVSEMLAINEPAAPFVEFLAQRAEGNPFFVAEYLRAALAEGLLRRVDSRSLQITSGAEGSVASLQALPFPATLRELISRRLGALSVEARARLELAAVVGREPGAELLDAIGGVDDSATTELLQRQILEPLQPGTLRFSHDKLREIAYEQIDAEKKRALHGRVVRALEAAHAGRPDFAATAPVLARHCLAAGDEPAAVGYFEQAATHALAVGAYHDAIAFLNQCLAWPGAEQPRVVRWRRQLADAHTGTGDLTARLLEAHRAIETAGSASAKTPMVLAVPRALYQLASQAIREQLGIRAALLPDERALRLELARAHRHVAVVHFFRNDRMVTMAVRLIDAIYSAERAAPISPEIAGAYAELGAWFGFAGLGRVGRHYLDRAVSVARQCGDPGVLSYSLMLDCLYSVGIGQFARALASADECQACCDRIDDHVNWGNAQIVRFWRHHYLGEQAASEAAAQGLLARARKVKNRQQETWGLTALGLAQLRGGDPGSALRQFEDALAQHELNDRNNLVLTRGCAALARQQLGQHAFAQRDALQAIDTFLAGGRPAGHASLEGLSASAEVLLAPGQRNPEPARRAMQGLRRYRSVFPVGGPRFLHWQGVQRSLAGSLRGAERSWQQGLEDARALGMAHDEQRILAAQKASRTK